MEVTVSYAEDASVLAEKSRRGAELAEFIASWLHIASVKQVGG